MKKSCYGCRYLVRDSESWEMPHIYWYECVAREANANLINFPFRNTTCKLWKKYVPIGSEKHDLLSYRKIEK